MSPALGRLKVQVKLSKTLSMSDPPQFIGRRLRLPCIIHQVTAVQLQQADPHTPRYVYAIQAEGLIPSEITLSASLTIADTSSTTLPYFLIRPWHSKLLASPTGVHDEAASEWVTRLGQPFSALLLEEQSGNEYKRIASSSVIITCLADTASILQSKVRILNVV